MRTTQSTRAPVLLQESTATAADEACPLTGRSDTPCSRQGLQSLRRDDVGKLLLPKDLSAPLGEQHSLSVFLSVLFLCFSNSGRGRAKGAATPLTRPRPSNPAARHSWGGNAFPDSSQLMSIDRDRKSRAPPHPADGCEAPTKERL